MSSGSEEEGGEQSHSRSSVELSSVHEERIATAATSGSPSNDEEISQKVRRHADRAWRSTSSFFVARTKDTGSFLKTQGKKKITWKRGLLYCWIIFEICFLITLIIMMIVYGEAPNASRCEIPEAPKALPDHSAALALYPQDNITRLNHFQAIDAHNAYHKKPPLAALATTFRYEWEDLDYVLGTNGARVMSLDIHYHTGFSILHIPVFDQRTTCFCAVDCLTILRTWSDANPGHWPLFIIIEPKDSVDFRKIGPSHYEEFEELILSVWPREGIITPQEVQGNFPTMREAVTTNGWPTLSTTRGRVLFILRAVFSDPKAYTGDLMFKGLSGSQIDEDGAAILSFGDPRKDEELIRKGAEMGFIVKTTADKIENEWPSGNDRFDAAIRSGAHFITTDFPSPVREGYPDNYEVYIPGGDPVGCNPVTASPGCTAQDMENLNAK